MAEFKHRVADLRRENNLTLEEFGSIFGKAKQTVSGWENGLSDPHAQTLNRMADYFNVSVDYLLGKTDVRTKNPPVTMDEVEKMIYDVLVEEGLVKKDDVVTQEVADYVKKALKTYKAIKAASDER